MTSSKFESKFYKEQPLFSTYASETAVRTPIEHFGPVGIGIDLLLPPFQMQVRSVEKGSPAEATGRIKVGQRIETINGDGVSIYLVKQSMVYIYEWMPG